MRFRRVLFLIALTSSLVAAGASTALAAEFRLIDKRTGAPIRGAEVLIVGLAGSVTTDADGRFTWEPDPVPPFEVQVILPGGRITKPLFIKSADWAAVLTIEVESAVNE
jgi:hypothetical protein